MGLKNLLLKQIFSEPGFFRVTPPCNTSANSEVEGATEPVRMQALPTWPLLSGAWFDRPIGLYW